jgi:hypothetical protein
MAFLRVSRSGEEALFYAISREENEGPLGFVRIV